MRKKMLWGGGILLLAALLTIFAGACEGPTQPPPTTPGPQGEQSDIDVTMSVSKPSNGQFFTAGEKPVITVTLKDASGAALAREDFSSLGLYMYGPQEPTKTVTAVKLLNASADRSKTPHHYIELAKDANVEVKDNVLKYNLQPVTDEEPGTYTVTLRASLKADPLQQDFEVVDVQIGTATVEPQIVEREKCAACHLGADSGQFYFHHVDPGRSPTGSPAIDSWPVKTCKSCHNNEGYAAFRDPTTGDRVPDPIVNRVHGVHNGSHLESVRNIGSQEANIAGIFGDYLHVEFPANVKNCTTCHVDDRWKTEPNRVACGACHDNTWFGDLAAKPETMEAHPGGPQTNDANCSTCHTPDSGGMAPPIS
ncbi:MAG: cytochrome c3 family protein, partial [Dehalococcoidales bacterium]|nr:cytochrome c3 family protein [Dehalococcoidales bacterium]